MPRASTNPPVRELRKAETAELGTAPWANRHVARRLRRRHPRQCRRRATYFPMMSNSMFTTEPGTMLWKLVFSKV